jgi:hypothetical protein
MSNNIVQQQMRDSARTGLGTIQEARMPRGDRILTLKNGSTAVVRHALADYFLLSTLFETEPDYFRALLVHLKAERNGLPAPKCPFKGAHEPMTLLFSKDGRLLPGVRDVLESGYRDTAEGPVFVQPFLLTNTAEKAFAELTEQQMQQWLANGMPGLPGDDLPSDRNR